MFGFEGISAGDGWGASGRRRTSRREAYPPSDIKSMLLAPPETRRRGRTLMKVR